MPDLSFEHQFYSQGLAPVGCDEVGRGCLAGPVVAAAVMLPDSLLDPKRFKGDFVNRETDSENESLWFELDDSKKVSKKKREILAEFIKENARVEIAWCLADEIDKINILQASMLAMRKALLPFSGEAKVVLVDGNMSPYAKNFIKDDPASAALFPRVETIIKGDSKSLSIAAASIVAKVFRDKWMGEFEKEFPGYGFAKHKGYSTQEHYRALEKLGPTPIHRMSFAPLKTSASGEIIANSFFDE